MHPNRLVARFLSFTSPEGIHPMATKAATYQGKTVTVVRPARQGDPDFKPGTIEQLIVKLADGSERTVPKAEVTEAE